MPKDNALIDEVKDLLPFGEPAAAERHSPPQLRVRFGRGKLGLLDTSTHRGRAWAEVLQSLRETGQPAYVEIEPSTGMITELLLPIRYTVARVTPAKDGLEIELVISQARHFLRRTHPEFAQFKNLFESALRGDTAVLVTESLAEHEIIDARPLPGTGATPVRRRPRTRG